MRPPRLSRLSVLPALLALGLAACATRPSINQELLRFHGNGIEALEALYGPPTEILGRRDWGRQRYSWRSPGHPLPEGVEDSDADLRQRFEARRDCVLRAHVDGNGRVIDVGAFGRDC